MRLGLGSLSLRARIMLIVIGGAILPLALIGAWLSASTTRSGRELLRSELDSSLAEIGQRIRERWTHREADLTLLADNRPANNLVGSGNADPETVRYLDALARGLRPTISEVTYRDSLGRARWGSNGAVDAGQAPLDARRSIVGFESYDAVLVRRTLGGAGERAHGFVEARILLSAILPTDSLQLIVAGAALRIRNRETGELLGGRRTTPAGATLVSAHASLADPPFDLELVASDAGYVQPFAHAARLGLVFLVVVAALALLLTAALTRRLTASLEQMVDAAGAVAGGDLDRVVSSPGDDEVGRLANAFNTMTDSLRRTMRELAEREALAAVGRFAASMSHEVRNALTAVRLDAQRLHERIASSDGEGALINRILRNVQRLDSIVTGSLRIARTSPETMRSVALEGVVYAALSTAEPSFSQAGVRATVSIDGSRQTRVHADPGALEQLFLNLLMNAAEAMEPGGVAAVSIERIESRVVVRIADTGHGIPTGQLARMGEPFSSSKSKGTGLGFSIARQIALSHGGNVTVACSTKAGTTVEVVLPAA